MDDLQDLLRQAAGGEPAPDLDTAPEVEPTPDPVPTPEPEPTPDPESTPEPEKKPNPMKEVRDRLNAEQKAKEKIEKAMQRYMDNSYDFNIRDFKTEDNKVDYDAFIAAMDAADNNTKAKTNGVSPEIQIELDRIEKEKQQIQQERLRVAMDRAVANMQTDMNLKSADINNFFKDSVAMSKNPYQWLAQGGTLSDLYYLVYRERILKEEVAKAVEEEKVKWSTQVKTPTPNPAAPSSSNPTYSGLSLDQLLSQAVKK